MALYGDLTHDSRVQREAATLAAAGHEVTVYCLRATLDSGAAERGRYRVVVHRPTASDVHPDGTSPFLQGPSSGAVRAVVRRVRWIVGYAANLVAWGRWIVREAGSVDAWHAHDLTGLLAVGTQGRGTSALVYDSHEIFLETGSARRLPGPFRLLLGRLERRWARQAVAVITVNESYGAVLDRRLRPRRLRIVRNCPPKWEPDDESSARLSRAIGVDPGVPVLLYHGGLTANRGIEQLVAAMSDPALESAHVVLLGFGDLRPVMAARAASPEFGGRLHVLDAVPPDDLLPWISGADVNVIALQPSTLNHVLCTPNKLWESIAAGVPVVVSDFAVMRGIVVDDPGGPLGAVCDPSDPRSIAAAAAAVLGDPAARARCRRVAHDRWNWELESEPLIALYGPEWPA